MTQQVSSRAHVPVRRRKKRPCKGLTELKKSDWLSPRGVADFRNCTDQTVRNALLREELDGISIHGAKGERTGWAIQVSDALSWEPRRPGRPTE